jgi:hypothetical protein
MIEGDKMRLYPNETKEEYYSRYKAYMEKDKDNIMLGTAAMGGGTTRHDISRDEPDYFFFNQETDHFYLGEWLTGFGFFNVVFPKATSRKPTEEEWQWLLDHPVVMG